MISVIIKKITKIVRIFQKKKKSKNKDRYTYCLYYAHYVFKCKNPLHLTSGLYIPDFEKELQDSKNSKEISESSSYDSDGSSECSEISGELFETSNSVSRTNEGVYGMFLNRPNVSQPIVCENECENETLSDTEDENDNEELRVFQQSFIHRIEIEKSAALEKERIEAERRETLEKKRIEAEKHAALEKERIEAERRATLEKERIEAEKHAALEKEHIEAERRAALEKERIEAEQKATLKKERIEAERRAALEAEEKVYFEYAQRVLQNSAAYNIFVGDRVTTLENPVFGKYLSGTLFFAKSTKKTSIYFLKPKKTSNRCLKIICSGADTILEFNKLCRSRHKEACVFLVKLYEKKTKYRLYVSTHVLKCSNPLHVTRGLEVPGF